MESDKKFALLRIAFGLVWAIDAWFKWQPVFQSSLVSMITSMADGQSMWIQGWIHLWVHIINIDPHLFGLAIALIETIIALGIVLGLFTRSILAGSIVFSILIWSIGEGFGGPYVAGSTDIGCGIIYAFVAAALLIGASWKAYSVDKLLKEKYPR